MASIRGDVPEKITCTMPTSPSTEVRALSSLTAGRAAAVPLASVHKCRVLIAVVVWMPLVAPGDPNYDSEEVGVGARAVRRMRGASTGAAG